jgi:hypothetical protein
MAYDRKVHRSGGGIGGVIAAVVIIGLLAGVAYVVWWKSQQLNAPRPKPTGPKATIEQWMSRYHLIGPIPEPLEKTWRFALQTTRQVSKAGSLEKFPGAWVDIQMEDGRFTGLVLAIYRDAPYGYVPLDLITELAGEAEGPVLLGYQRDLGGMPDGTAIEKETANWRLFAWRYNDEAVTRRAVICIAHKSGGPQTEELYSKEKKNWASIPKRPPEPPKRPEIKPAEKEPAKETAPAPAPPAAPAKEGDKT